MISPLLASPASERKSEGGCRTNGHCKAEGCPSAKANDNPIAPLVSIVTVVFNGASYLEETIQSVLNQTYHNIEYIIIDGGSSDNTLDILNNYDNSIDYWISEPDKGIYDAMNKGIKIASGTTIGLLNCGDTYERWFVEKLVDLLPDPKAISSTVLFCNFKVSLEELSLTQYHRSHMACWQGMSICHQAMLIGKDIYAEQGLYDPFYKLAADYEFLLRMTKNKVSFRGSNDYGVTVRHSGMTVMNMDASHREARRIHRSYFGTFSHRHLLFLVKSWRQVLVYYYIKMICYRMFGTNFTNRIRHVKKLFSKFIGISRST